MILHMWPDFDEAKPSAFYVDAAKVFNNFRSFGEMNPFAISMVTMADMEASFQIGVVGDQGSAFGLWQEHKDRAARIKEHLGIDLLAKPAPSIADQCHAAYWELNNSELKARNAIRSMTNAEDAAAAATRYFERAGAPDAIDRRRSVAARWVVWFSDNMPWVIAQGV